MFRDFITCYYKINEIYKFKKYSFKRAFFHLLLLTLIFGSIQAYAKTNYINKKFQESISTLSSWNFRIQNGKFLIEDTPKELYIDNLMIYFPKENENPALDLYGEYMIVKENYIEFHINSSIQNIPLLNSESLTKEEFLNSLKITNKVFNVLNFLFTLIAFFLGKIISAYFVSALSYHSLIARILNYKFSDFFKLSFYIMTPIVTIQSILFALGFKMLISDFASISFTFACAFICRLIMQYEYKLKH